MAFGLKSSAFDVIIILLITLITYFYYYKKLGNLSYYPSFFIFLCLLVVLNTFLLISFCISTCCSCIFILFVRNPPYLGFFYSIFYFWFGVPFSPFLPFSLTSLDLLLYSIFIAVCIYILFWCRYENILKFMHNICFLMLYRIFVTTFLYLNICMYTAVYFRISYGKLFHRNYLSWN